MDSESPYYKLGSRPRPAESCDRDEETLTAADEVCKRFCRYYKPDRKEDLACRGFVLAERLFARGLRYPVKACGSEVTGENEAFFRKEICPVCPFHEDGCDFFVRVEGAPACGGLIFLYQLLESGDLSIDDLRDII